MGSLGVGTPDVAGPPTPSGYRMLPRAGGVTVEAWGPDRESCLREAVLGTVASFADTAGATAEASCPLYLGTRTDADALVYLLDEAIYSVRVRRLVPVDAVVERGLHAAPCILFRSAPLDYRIRIIGPCPRSVSREDLRLAADVPGLWCARVALNC